MKVKNQKAQALVEFALILPILIMMIFAIIDFGNIFVAKSNLENKMPIAQTILKKSTDISTIYDEISNSVNKNSKDLIQVELAFSNDSDLVTIKLSKDVDIITPGLNLVFGNKYNAQSESVVIYDQQ